MNDKILFTLLDAFRNEPWNLRDRIIVCLLLLAWWKVSNQSDLELSEHLKINNRQEIEPMALKSVFHEIYTVSKDDSFNDENSLLISKVSYQTLGVLMEQISIMSIKGHLQDFNPADVTLLISQNETNIPKELADFMVLLAGDIANKKVYLPWESTGQLAGRVISNKGEPIVESDSDTGYSNLIATIISGQPIKVLHDDLFINPGLVANGELVKLPLAISHLRFRGYLDKAIYEYDLLGRFKHKTRSFAGLTISHLLKQIKGLIIITVPESFLFSSTDGSLREDLIKDQQVESVINMPKGLLGTSMVGFSIVVLNTEKKCHKVRFVNTDTPDYSFVKSKTQAKLINIEKLLQVINSSYEDENVKNIPTDEILNKNSLLVVSHYILNKKESAAAKIIAEMDGIPLHSFADLIAPRALVYKTEGLEVAEVGTSDLPNFGYIQSASKSLKIEGNNKMKSMFLRPNDIILVIKGSVGKVGIVPEDAPKDYWLAGRSSVVVRLHQDSPLNAKVLFLFLRSDLGREIVGRLYMGGTVSFIQLKQLQDLLLPVPTEYETTKALAVFEEEGAIQKEISALQKRQFELSLDFWKIN